MDESSTMMHVLKLSEMSKSSSRNLNFFEEKCSYLLLNLSQLFDKWNLSYNLVVLSLKSDKLIIRNFHFRFTKSQNFRILEEQLEIALLWIHGDIFVCHCQILKNIRPKFKKGSCELCTIIHFILYTKFHDNRMCGLGEDRVWRTMSFCFDFKLFSLGFGNF